MKKKMIAYMSAAMVVTAGLVVCQKMLSASDMLLEANVEALSYDEPGTGLETKKCYSRIHDAEALQVFYCPVCDWVPGDHGLFAIQKTCTVE